MGRSEQGWSAARAIVAMVVLSVAASAVLYGTTPGAELNELCNRWTAATNAWLLSACGVPTVNDENFIYSGAFSVLIVERCNGLRAVVLLLPAIVCLPCRFGTRALGCVIAVVTIGVLNQARLVVEMLFGSLYPQHYDFLETYVMRAAFAVLLCVALMRWIAFVRPIRSEVNS